ncbi:hypothetical protein EV361DRAFT_955394 [Lentinula raphanica]|nr:hypothetical protein EV361DRAFT_955394 [Lentinula raphanica]
MNPMGRMGDVEELSGAVILLCSKRAGRYINGADIVVDGIPSFKEQSMLTPFANKSQTQKKPIKPNTSSISDHHDLLSDDVAASIRMSTALSLACGATDVKLRTVTVDGQYSE